MGAGADAEILGLGLDSSLAKAGADEFERATARVSAAALNTGKAIDRVDVASQQAVAGIRRMVGQYASLAAEVFATRKLIEYADAWKRVEGQLNIVTKSTDELVRAQESLFGVAQRNRQSYESVAELYA